ncbi:MAG: restriction endonuclease subunit S [Azonexus sp.]|jgi:type I restriction enzyme S subunit|nr:restriction endonuclease subunit S [Azonexus sp.]
MSSKNDITARKEEAMPALVPKLRFPEFREADAWEPTTIGALGRFYYGKSAPKWSLAEDAPTPCVRYGELYTKFGPVITETYSRTNTAPETLRFSKGGEILIPRVGEKPEDFGKCCAYLPLKGIAIGEMISVLETRQHPLFYTYYFRNLHRQFAKVVEGQNVKNLYFAELEPLPIHRPSLPEQQKIAECLSSVDELMAAQARKVEALKTHKKGLMQQLFPCEGETQPRLRFPEFETAGEWEETNLGDYFDPIRNGFVGTATPYYTTSEGVRYLQGRNIKQGRIEANNLIFITSDFHNRQRKSHLKTGDILMVQSGHVGECAVVGPDFAGANCHALVILTPKRKLSSEFFAHYFYSPIGELAIFQITTGNTIKHILASELKTLPVLVPDLAEQQRIASCLSSLDALISAETQHLEALKTHKKGLMQQLFPSPTEVEA